MTNNFKDVLISAIYSLLIVIFLSSCAGTPPVGENPSIQQDSALALKCLGFLIFFMMFFASKEYIFSNEKN